MIPTSTETLPAVAYVRMSTEHQQYSTANQFERVKDFAARRGMAIIRTYADEGKSGLNVKGRESLQRMIEEVTSGTADFRAILVYDVSRWGRFQDADESGYYEYICRKAGITVHYCAEQFENDGSPTSNIIKSVKRSMAGEYSRELSTKVFQGACRLINLGFKQGGAAGFGLRRMLVDQSGQQKQTLGIGEQKSIATDRIILVPGPEHEREVVRWMYEAFVQQGLTENEIAADLNRRGVKTDLGRNWTRGTVHQVLTNEKYIGNNVYHKTSCKLKQRHVRNTPDKWIRTNGAFAPVVDTEIFIKARQIVMTRSVRYTNEELLARLRDVLSRHGRISGLLIDEDAEMPSSSVYRLRFGSLVRAYQMVGYTPETDFAFIEINRSLRAQHPGMVKTVIEGLHAIGAEVTQDPGTDQLLVNQEYFANVVLCRCHRTDTGAGRWLVRLEHANPAHLTIAVRMNPDNATIKDYYLLPSIDMHLPRLRLAEENGTLLDAYRFDNLDYFFALAERTAVQDVEVA
jgi:DNA invertase Pin-like site-specific DNA recombinase